MDELTQVIDQIGSLAQNISQNKVFTSLLAEHVFHAYQQLHTEHLKKFPNPNYVNVALESAKVLLEVLKNDPQSERLKDKQSTYLFERESTEITAKLKKQIDALNKATPSGVIRHPRAGYENDSGIFSISETCGPKATTVFHLLNEPDTLLLEQAAEEKAKENNTEKSKYIGLPSERKKLMTMTMQHLNETSAAQNAQVRVIVVSGAVGVGKSYYSLQAARAIEDKYKGDQSFQKFHIRLRGCTEFPMTSLEAKQQVIKMWYVGSLPVRDQKVVDDLYNKSFFGKVSVIILEDANSLKQVLELIPNVKQSAKSYIYMIVETRTASINLNNTNLDKIAKYTTGQVDFMDEDGVVCRKPDAKELEEEQVSDHDSDFEDELSDDEDLENEEDGKKKEEKNAVREQLAKMFGKYKRKTVSVTLLEDEDEELMDEDEAIAKLVNRMTYFYVLFVHLGKLSLDGSAELVTLGNSRAKAEAVKTLGVLLDNIPIFLKIVGRTHFLYCSDDQHAEKLSTQEMVRYISTQVDSVAKKRNYTKIRQLCHGSFIGCFKKWPDHIQRFVLLISLWPNCFDPVTCSLITQIPLSQVLLNLFDLVQIGVVYIAEPFRYAFHDLARETYLAHLYEPENASMVPIMEEAKRRYLQFYFNVMKRVNMEHQYSGIEFMPGLERYDLECENIKSVIQFMQEKETDHIDAINSMRYILRHRILAVQRGLLYQHLSKHLNDCESTFAKGHFLEGFAYVYYDLTDYERAHNMAKQALEILDDEISSEDNPNQEIELLGILRLLGDILLQVNQFDEARKYFERMVTIVERLSKPHQLKQITVQIEGFEGESYVMIDPFYAYAQKALAVISLSKGDLAGGVRFFERGINVMKHVLCENHPELSQSYASYASILVKLKAKQFFDEICRLMEKAIAIDTTLFGDKSVIVGDRLNDYGVALLSMSRYAPAEACFRKALIIRQKNFGLKDMTVAETTNNLAVACKNVGKFDESEKLYRRALEITVELFGENDPLVAVSSANLAMALSALGKTDDAKIMFDQAIKALTEGANSKEDAAIVATMLQQMGENARKQEKFEESLKYFEQALTIRKQISESENDPEIAKILSSIAQLYFDQGRYEECETLLNDSLGLLEKTYGKRHPAYHAALSTLGNSKFKRKKYADAEKILNECLQLKKEAGESAFQLSLTQHALAILYDQIKKYEQAIANYKEIVKTIESLKPVDKPKLKLMMQSLASCLTKKNQFLEALTYFEKIAKLVLEESGENSLEYGNSLYNIGACQLSSKQFDEAEKTFALAYTIFTEKLGTENEKTIETANMLAEVRRIIYERDVANKKCCNVM
jgi:tetratricopeptide (TPR) repeat protein